MIDMKYPVCVEAAEDKQSARSKRARFQRRRSSLMNSSYLTLKSMTLGANFRMYSSPLCAKKGGVMNKYTGYNIKCYDSILDYKYIYFKYT